MQFTKKGITIAQQAQLLKGRNMGGALNVIEDRLRETGYFRLSGYWYPFLDPTRLWFNPGTTIDEVWRRYTFDRRLRVLVFDAIERIEVFVRAALADAIVQSNATGDPFAYAHDRNVFLNAGQKGYARLLQKLLKDHSVNSKSEFIVHFNKVYGDCHDTLPLWMATEIMTFGTVEDMFKFVDAGVQQKISALFGVKDVVFRSWLKTLRAVRNLVAHHGRLWNRSIRMKPIIPNKDPMWRVPVRIANDRTFGILSICRYCLKSIAPQSKWQSRLEGLFSEYQDISLSDMGFPANWRQSKIWE